MGNDPPDPVAHGSSESLYYTLRIGAAQTGLGQVPSMVATPQGIGHAPECLGSNKEHLTRRTLNVLPTHPQLQAFLLCEAHVGA